MNTIIQKALKLAKKQKQDYSKENNQLLTEICETSKRLNNIILTTQIGRDIYLEIREQEKNSEINIEDICAGQTKYITKKALTQEFREFITYAEQTTTEQDANDAWKQFKTTRIKGDTQRYVTKEFYKRYSEQKKSEENEKDENPGNDVFPETDDALEKKAARIYELDAKLNSARKNAVINNTRLIYTIAQNYSKKFKRIDIETAFQEGCIGLMRAFESFDPSKGVMFSTYAHNFIRRQIQAFYENNSTTLKTSKKDQTKIEQIRKYIQTKEKENKTLHWSESLLEHSDAINLSKNEIETAIQAYYARFPDSLDAAINLQNNNKNKYGITPDRSKKRPDETLEIRELQRLIENLLSEITSRQQYLIKQRFLEGNTCVELSKEEEVSPQRINQLTNKGLKTMRSLLTTDELCLIQNLR